MRRFLAYIVMMLTMISVLVFNTQAVIENKVDAMEYDQGTQIVYSLGYRNADDYDGESYPSIKNGTDHLSEIDIESEIMNRLSVAGVRDSDVKIVKGDSENDEGYQLKVTIAPLSETDLNNVKEILVKTGSLSMGSSNDVMFYQDKGDFFADTVAEIVYVDNVAYPAINLKDANAYDSLKKACDEANGNVDTSSDDDESSSSSTAYLWMNKANEDTYAKAFGTDDTVIDPIVKAKVLANIDLSLYDSENHQIRLTSDLNGNAFTSSTSRAFVNMLNCGDYGFDITYLYENKVSPDFGTKGLMRTYITFGIVLIALFVLSVLAYGMAGLSGGLTMLASVFVSFLLSSLLGFEFSVSFIAGLVVIAFLSFLVSGNYFSRVKAELKKGRDLQKANHEGYHKGFLTGLDISVIALTTSILCFLVSVGSLKTFFGVIMIGTVFTFLLTNYFDKWLMYWLAKSDKQNLPYFSFFKQKEKEHKPVIKKDSKSNKPLLIAIPAVLAALLAVSLPVGYMRSQGSSFFHESGDYSTTFTLNISFEYHGMDYTDLSVKSTYLSYLEEIGSKSTIGQYVMVSDENKDDADLTHGFVYYPETCTVNTVEVEAEADQKNYTIYFSVETDKDVSAVITENGTNALNVINDEIKYGTTDIIVADELIKPSASGHFEADSLVATSYLTTPTHIAYNTNNFFLVIFIMSVFAMVYTFLRYGMNMALTQLCTGSLVAAGAVALLAILPIPYNSLTVFGALLPVFAANLLIVPLFNQNKETIKSRGLKKTATLEDHESIMNEVSPTSYYFISVSYLALILASVAFFFLSNLTMGMSIVCLASLLVAGLIAYFFSYRFYFLLTTHVSFRKLSDFYNNKKEQRRIKKKEAKPVASKDGIVYVDQDISHETIIVGMNDFRR